MGNVWIEGVPPDWTAQDVIDAIRAMADDGNATALRAVQVMDDCDGCLAWPSPGVLVLVDTN